MINVVLTPPALDVRARAALLRALERFPATIEPVALEARGARLLAHAADPNVEFIVVVDGDAILVPEAFGALRRALTERTAIVGGRALVGAIQRFGEMLAPSRSGPNPFELAHIVAPHDDRAIVEYIRGPIDVPHRGAYVVNAAFVRSLGAIALDPLLMHLDLAVHARVAGYTVTCEPALTFAADDDSVALRTALGNLRRYADAADWNPDALHREPVRLRSAFVAREVRVMGNIRGYARRVFPPVDVLVLAGDEIARARAQRAATPLAVNGRVIVCDPADGEALRTELAHTSERYLLVADANAMPDRTRLDRLAERLERSGPIALALESAAAPFGAALFHCGRLIKGGMLAGATVTDVIAAAIAELPARRRFAAAPSGRIVPQLPERPRTIDYDVIFIAASKPVVTEQTVRAALGEVIRGTMTAVYPAAATTVARMLSSYAGLVFAPDASDVHLAAGVNRVLGTSTAHAIAIVRDDAQLPHGVLDRLADAFRRIPALGIAVPRVGGSDRPESLPDLGYRSSLEMQLLYDRRAEAFAREATLLDFASSPVVMVSRELLEVIGGFDEQFGFSRLGVEDFSRRARSANFLVACCEDAYTHVFSAEEAQSFVGNLDASPMLRTKYERRWSSATGFTPADRVPLRIGEVAPAAAPATATSVRLLVPMANDDDWKRAYPLLVELAATFRVTDPIEVAVGLDGTFGVQEALAALRDVLMASNVPMDETINVTIDFVGDMPAWRDAGTNNVRVRGLERDVLAGLPEIADVAGVRALLTVPVA